MFVNIDGVREFLCKLPIMLTISSLSTSNQVRYSNHNVYWPERALLIQSELYSFSRCWKFPENSRTQYFAQSSLPDRSLYNHQELSSINHIALWFVILLFYLYSKESINLVVLSWKPELSVCLFRYHCQVAIT